MMPFLRRILSFRGRRSRTPFLGCTAVVQATDLGGVLALALLYAVFRNASGGWAVAALVLLALPVIAAMLAVRLVELAFTARRLHDIGFSAWHLFWVHGPAVAAFAIANLQKYADVPVGALGAGEVFWPWQVFRYGVLAWLGATPGTDGENRFGADPGADGGDRKETASAG